MFLPSLGKSLVLVQEASVLNELADLGRFE